MDDLDDDVVASDGELHDWWQPPIRHYGRLPAKPEVGVKVLVVAKPMKFYRNPTFANHMLVEFPGFGGVAMLLGIAILTWSVGLTSSVPDGRMITQDLARALALHYVKASNHATFLDYSVVHSWWLPEPILYNSKRSYYEAAAGEAWELNDCPLPPKL